MLDQDGLGDQTLRVKKSVLFEHLHLLCWLTYRATFLLLTACSLETTLSKSFFSPPHSQTTYGLSPLNSHRQSIAFLSYVCIY